MKPNLLKSRRQETLLFAALCFCIAASTNAECPVPVDRQGYVTEIVQKLTFDLAFVGINVHDLDRGFALSLFGTDTGSLGQLLLIDECTQREVFDSYVESVRQPLMTRRLQLICEGPGVDVIRVEAASGHGQNGDFSKLTYRPTRFPGAVAYEPFPTADWRTVKTGTDGFTVGAAIYRRLTFDPIRTDRVDLTHIGALSLRVVNDKSAWGLVQAVFPNVAVDGQPVTVEVQTNANGDASGAIKSNGNALAVISGTAFEPIIAWACSGPAL
jgi:hypothetical protein